MSIESMFRRKENPRGKIQLAALNNVSFSSPDRLLFYGVNLSIKRGENTALVGPSGVGKSTLLKIVLGLETPDTGTRTLANDIRVSYVPQDIEDLQVDDNVTIKELFYKSRGLDHLERIKTQLEYAMAQPVGQKELDRILKDYNQVSELYEELGGYTAESEIDSIMAGLKLDPRSTRHITQQTRLNEVSSGQRTRILIGQALFANADLLILDDPTSHLDVESVSWFSNYLKKSDQASLIATNNFPFINGCSNKVVEITDFGRELTFDGNYRDYLTKRDRLLEAERSEANSVKAEKERLEATYNNFKAKQVFKRSSDMAQVGRALQTRIQKLEDRYHALPGSKQVYREEKVRDLNFESEYRSGENVVAIRNVQKKYGNFLALDLKAHELVIRRGELFVISGENGSGKSTLLRMIGFAMKKEQFTPSSGTIEIGSNVKMAYFAPDHTGISAAGTVFDEVRAVTKHRNESEATSVLHFWGFPNAVIRTKTIESLSEGERKQLALAKIMVQHPNLLLLDEPTDYLKPEIIERLAKALKKYDGTAILVSHNPEFKKLLHINRELELPEGKIVLRFPLK